MDVGKDGAAVVWHPLSRFVVFVESILADPAGLSHEEAVRLRRFLIRVANRSRPAMGLAGSYERGEINSDQRLKMMW
jgi:hypothetical protein